MKAQNIIYIVLLLTFCSWLSFAQIPRTLSYQGVLTDSLGNPKPDGSYSLTFRLYDVESGGSALWSESKTLTVRRGLFITILGDQVLFGSSVTFDKPYWLSIQIAANPELSPRIQLTAVGYSLNAVKADTASYAKVAPAQLYVDSARIAGTVANNAVTTAKLSDNAVTSAKIQDGQVQTNDLADGAISTAKLADNTVTNAKIQSGQVVKSINTLKDDVTLSAGSNVTITPSGNTLTIAATPGGGGTITGVTAGTGLTGGGTSGTVTLNVATPLSLSGTTGSPGAIVSGTNTGSGEGISGSNSSYGCTGYLGGYYGAKGTRGDYAGYLGFSDGGVLGQHVPSGNWGYLGMSNYGVRGYSSNGEGMHGESSIGKGVYGKSTSGQGVHGESASGEGVYGNNSITGSTGYLGGSYGANGTRGDYIGYLGFSDGGVLGQHLPSGNYGYLGMSNYGVRGYSTSGEGVYGGSSSGYGVHGNKGDYNGYLGFSDGGVFGKHELSGNWGYLGTNSYGVWGSSTSGDGIHGESSSGSGVYGTSTYGVGVWGNSTNFYGVYGRSTAPNYAGVRAANDSGYGVFGSGSQAGVYGTSTFMGVYGVGQYAVEAVGGAYGVDGWCSNGIGVSGGSTTSFGVVAYTTSGTAIFANGNFTATGTKSAEVKINNGTPIRLFTEEATEVYFADYGKGTLSSGRTHIELDPKFLQTVTIDANHPLSVFVQLEGDCKGVFVTNKTTTGFDVVELQGGMSSVQFTYRVVCKRKYFEDERLPTSAEDNQINRKMQETAWPEVVAKHQEEEAKRNLVQDRAKAMEQRQK